MKKVNNTISEILDLYEYVDLIEELIDENTANKMRDKIKNILNNTKKDPINEIIRFQKDRLLDKQEFNFETEVLHILEELVEMIGYESLYAREKAKTVFQHFKNHEHVEEEKLVDAFADIVVFSVGSIMKLGYDPKCVLNEVSKEINSRVGSIVDGKFVKNKSQEARAKWYKAQYFKCKKENNV